MNQTQFSYVQIGAKNYQALADFYVNALGFTPCAEQTWLCGNEGICLSAPGFTTDKATVFGFVPAVEGNSAQINDTGFAHICFETESVKHAVKQLLKFGGSVHSTMKHPEMHPCVYCKDPEGNLVEFHIPFPASKTASELGHTAKCLLGLSSSKALKFIHVNIICADWESLCQFYNNVFQCSPIGSIKNHQGNYKENVIGVQKVHVVGQHILLPGFEKDYPTLEVFTYSIPGRIASCDMNALGIQCIGFTCIDRHVTAQSLLRHGGIIYQMQNEYILAGDTQHGKILLR